MQSFSSFSPLEWWLEQLVEIEPESVGCIGRVVD